MPAFIQSTVSFDDILIDLISIDILSQNFEREVSLGKFIADYMQYMYGKKSVLLGFSSFSAEKCQEDQSKEMCTSSMYRNNKCKGD